MNDGQWQLCRRNKVLFYDREALNHFGIRESISSYTPDEASEFKPHCFKLMGTVLKQHIHYKLTV